MTTALPRRTRRSFAALLLTAAMTTSALAADDKKPELLKPVAAPDGTAAAAVAPAPTNIGWKKTQLSKEFHSEGASFGDFNKDGKMDIVSGPFWYEGPDFSPDKKHAYVEGKPFDPKNYSKNFFAFTHDFNGDGWTDILIYGFPGEDASWYENPAGAQQSKEKLHWARHKVFNVVDNESPGWADITGDGKPEIVFSTGKNEKVEGKDDKGNDKQAYVSQLGYATPDWSDPKKPWTFHPISAKGRWGKFTHGMGYGDVNGDGKTDILMHEGWWEQPASLGGDPEWKYHNADFGPGGAQMFAYDVNGDGRPDVITSLQAHGYGVAWFEQKPDGKFEKHLIVGSKAEENPQGVKFSQPHAIDLVDMDGDGLKDLVTGKRWWAHGPSGDAEPNAPAVLYWFQLVRKDGKAEFVAHLIDDNSGIGTQVIAGDINGDKKPDVVVGNKQGTFVHIQQAK